MKDVARAANVSIATVSYYLNGKKIKKENQERIEKAIHELDYQLNRVAKALRTSETLTIGVVFNLLTTKFGMEIISKIEEWFDQHGYSVIICSTQNDITHEAKKIMMLLEKGVDGIVFFPVSSKKSYITKLIDHQIPVVIIDHFSTDTIYDCVLTDNEQATFQLAKHLISNGHKDFVALTGDNTFSTSVERKNGILKALQEASIPVTENMFVSCKYEVLDAYNKTLQILDRSNRPTALIATNYDLAMGSIQAIHKRNLRIPEDISFVALDMEYYEFDRGITSIIQPTDQIATTAAQTLLDRIKSNQLQDNITIRLSGIFKDHGTVKKISQEDMQ